MENVRELTVHTEWLPDADEDEWLANVWTGYVSRFNIPQNLSLSNIGSMIKEQKQSDSVDEINFRDRFEAFRAAVKDQNDLRDSGEGIRFLRDALSNFPKLTKITIENWPEEHPDLLLYDDYLELPRESPSYAIGILFQALAKMSIDALRCIEVHDDRFCDLNQSASDVLQSEEPSTAAVVELLSSRGRWRHYMEEEPPGINELPEISVIHGISSKVFFSLSRQHDARSGIDFRDYFSFSRITS